MKRREQTLRQLLTQAASTVHPSPDALRVIRDRTSKTAPAASSAEAATPPEGGTSHE